MKTEQGHQSPEYLPSARELTDAVASAAALLRDKLHRCYRCERFATCASKRLVPNVGVVTTRACSLHADDTFVNIPHVAAALKLPGLGVR